MSKDSNCGNYKKTTLIRHAGLEEQRLMVSSPSLRKDIKMCDSKTDKEMQIVFRSLHFLICEDMALVKFEALIDFLHNLIITTVITFIEIR